MKHYRSAPWLTVLVFCLGCAMAAQAQAPGALTIQRVEPLAVAGEPLYYRIVVGCPPQSRQGNFSFTVNGKPVPFQTIASDSGANQNTRAFRIYLEEPGHKRIEVAMKLGEKTAQTATELDYQARGGMVLLGHYDGEVLFGNEEISVLAWLIRDAQIKVNGNAIKVEIGPVAEMKGLFTLTGELKLRPGMNLVEYSGTDLNGQSFSRSASIFLMNDRRVNVGDRLAFAYGRPKLTAEDPELRLQITGDALAENGASQHVTIYGLDGSWLSEMTLFVQPLIARHVGTATLDIVAEYTTGFQNTTSLVVTVESAVKQQLTPEK